MKLKIIKKRENLSDCQEEGSHARSSNIVARNRNRETWHIVAERKADKKVRKFINSNL